MVETGAAPPEGWPSAGTSGVGCDDFVEPASYPPFLRSLPPSSASAPAQGASRAWASAEAAALRAAVCSPIVWARRRGPDRLCEQQAAISCSFLRRRRMSRSLLTRTDWWRRLQVTFGREVDLGPDEVSLAALRTAACGCLLAWLGGPSLLGRRLDAQAAHEARSCRVQALRRAWCRHLATCLVARSTVVLLFPRALVPGIGPTFSDFGRLVDGRTPLGHRVDVAVPLDAWLSAHTKLSATMARKVFQHLRLACANCDAATRRCCER